MTALVFTLVLATAWGYTLVSTVLALRFARRPIVAPTDGPSASLLKPLHGAEPGLAENLRSFVDQDYSPVQMVFGVRDAADAAVPIAQALIADRPNRGVELVIDPRAGGSNLKVCNLENIVRAATGELIVLADSDMRVTRDYLGVVTAPLAEPGVGIVTCLYKGAPGDGIWSRLAALYINYGFLPSALVGEAIGVGGGCFGATIALRRSTLARIGGFARFRHELADDHRMGAAVRALGLKTVLSPYIVENHVTEPSFADLWQHELRWARTSRAMAPGGFAGSILTHLVPVVTLAALVEGSPAAWGCVLLSLALRWITASMIGRSLDLPRTGLWLLPLRDALSFATFIGSFCGRSVQWRRQMLRVEPSGRMSVQGDGD